MNMTDVGSAPVCVPDQVIVLQLQIHNGASPTVSRVLYDLYFQNEGNRIIILLNVKQAFLFFQCASKSCKFFCLGNNYSSFYFSWLRKGFLSLSLFLVL